MLETQAQEAIAWAMKKLDSYDNEKKLYNISAIILSILDVICGVVAIFYTSMIVTSVVASIVCGTIWSGRCIQLIKAERLAKSLKVLSTVSIAYIAVRKKRSEYMKKLLQNIKNNPLTIIFALLSGGIMAFTTFKLAQLYFINLPLYLYIIFAVIAAIVTVILVVVLGWDSVKNAVLRSAKKNLNDENYNKVVELVGTLENAEKQTKQEQAENAKKLKDVEQAKATIAKYEAQVAEQAAQKEAYENAKKVIAENEKPTETADETVQDE